MNRLLTPLSLLVWDVAVAATYLAYLWTHR